MYVAHTAVSVLRVVPYVQHCAYFSSHNFDFYLNFLYFYPPALYLLTCINFLLQLTFPLFPNLLSGAPFYPPFLVLLSSFQKFCTCRGRGRRNRGGEDVKGVAV